MYGFWTNLNRVAFLLCCAVLFLVRFCFETDSRSPRHRLFMRPKTDVSTTSVDAVAPIGGAAHWKVRMGESLWERPLSLSLSQKLFSVSFVYPNIFIEKFERARGTLIYVFFYCCFCLMAAEGEIGVCLMQICVRLE